MIFIIIQAENYFLHYIFCVILFTAGYVFDAFFETKPFLNHEGRMTAWEIITILSLFNLFFLE